MGEPRASRPKTQDEWRLSSLTPPKAAFSEAVTRVWLRDGGGALPRALPRPLPALGEARPMVCMPMALCFCLLFAACALRTPGGANRKGVQRQTEVGCTKKTVTSVGCPADFAVIDQYLEEHEAKELHGGVTCYEVETPNPNGRSLKSSFYFFDIKRQDEVSCDRPIAVHFGGPGSDGISAAAWGAIAQLQGNMRCPMIAFAQPGTSGASLLPSCPVLDDPPTEGLGRMTPEAYAPCFEGANPDDFLGYLTANGAVDDLKAFHQVEFPDVEGEAPKQLDFWGISYGTSVAKAFDAKFPGRVGHLLLTGVDNPSGTPYRQATLESMIGFGRFLRALSAHCRGNTACGVLGLATAGGQTPDFAADLELLLQHPQSIELLPDLTIAPGAWLDVGRAPNSLPLMGVVAAALHGIAEDIRQTGTAVIDANEGMNLRASQFMTIARQLWTTEEVGAPPLSNAELLKEMYMSSGSAPGLEANLYLLILCIEFLAAEEDPSLENVLSRDFPGYDAFWRAAIPGVENATTAMQPYCTALENFIGVDAVRAYRTRLMQPAPTNTPALLITSTFDNRTPVQGMWKEAASLSHRRVVEPACKGHGDIFGPNACDFTIMNRFFSGESLETLDLECICREAPLNLATNDGISFASTANPSLRTSTERDVPVEAMCATDRSDAVPPEDPTRPGDGMPGNPAPVEPGIGDPPPNAPPRRGPRPSDPPSSDPPSSDPPPSAPGNEAGNNPPSDAIYDPSEEQAAPPSGIDPGQGGDRQEEGETPPPPTNTPERDANDGGSCSVGGEQSVRPSQLLWLLVALCALRFRARQPCQPAGLSTSHVGP